MPFAPPSGDGEGLQCESRLGSSGVQLRGAPCRSPPPGVRWPRRQGARHGVLHEFPCRLSCREAASTNARLGRRPCCRRGEDGVLVLEMTARMNVYVVCQHRPAPSPSPLVGGRQHDDNGRPLSRCVGDVEDAVAVAVVGKRYARRQREAGLPFAPLSVMGPAVASVTWTSRSRLSPLLHHRLICGSSSIRGRPILVEHDHIDRGGRAAARRCRCRRPVAVNLYVYAPSWLFTRRPTQYFRHLDLQFPCRSGSSGDGDRRRDDVALGDDLALGVAVGMLVSGFSGRTAKAAMTTAGLRSGSR